MKKKTHTGNELFTKAEPKNERGRNTEKYNDGEKAGPEEKVNTCPLAPLIKEY